jgi:hypothetical protein
VIRRYQGNEFWLFTQEQHAQIAGRLMACVGGSRWTLPTRPDSLKLAALHHEAGWRVIDAHPLLSNQRYPLDALEAHWSIALDAWLGSTRHVDSLGDDYATLLVSILGLQQSNDVGKITERASRFDPSEMRKAFSANQYQHREIEIQESIRPKLGLAIDEPRRLGLAVDLLAGPEKTLANDYRWLSVIDAMSLSILATDVIAGPLGPLLTGTGLLDHIKLRRSGPATTLVDPWPFDIPEIRVNAVYRAYPAVPTRSLPEFQHQYASTVEKSVELFVRPG